MAKKASPYQLAVQLYSFRDQCKTARQCASTLKKLRKQGWHNVQISGPIDQLDAFEVKKLVDDAGMKIIGHHTGLSDLRDGDKRNNLIDRLHVWDCNYTAVAYLPDNLRRNGADYIARGKEMTKFGHILAEEGIFLQYHNHAFELQKFGGKKGIGGGKTGLQLIYENSCPKCLQAELDTHWIARGGGDPASWILCMKGRMDQIHLKDCVIVDNAPTFAPIGEGNLNWDAILKAARKIKVKDYIVEQDQCNITGSPFKAFEYSYRNLRKMGLK